MRRLLCEYGIVDRKLCGTIVVANNSGRGFCVANC